MICGQAAARAMVPRASGSIVNIASISGQRGGSGRAAYGAAKAGLINPKEGGEPGSLEKKWGVDIVLHVKDYDPCVRLVG